MAGRAKRWLGGALLALAGCSGAPQEPATTPGTTASPAPALPPGVIGGMLPRGARLTKAEGHLAKVTCLAFSPDGRQLVSGSEDRTLLIWDVASGQIVQRLEGHHGFVSGCAFLPDGRRVVSGGWGGEVFLWDAATGGTPRQIGDLRVADAVHGLAVRPDGREIMVGTEHGGVRAWDLDTGKQTFASDALSGASNLSTVWTVGYLEDGRWFGAGESGATVVWEKAKPHKAHRIEYHAFSGLPLPGSRLLLGGWKEVVLMNLDGSKQTIGTWEGWVYGLALSPRRDLVVAGDDQGHTRVWALAGSTLRCELSPRAGIRAAAFDPTGERFAVASADGALLLVHTEECRPGNTPAMTLLRAGRSRMSSVATGTSVLLGDGAGRVSRWNSGAWRLQESVQAHHAEVLTLTLLPDGRWVSGGNDNLITLSGKQIGQLTNSPNALQPSPDGSSVLTADDAGRLTSLSLHGSGPTELLHVDGQLVALAVRPGKAEIVTGGILRDLYRITLPPQGDPIRWPWSGWSTLTLAYDPDGRWLAEGDANGNVALRNPDTGIIERHLDGLHTQVHGLTLTRDYLWAGDSDGRLLRWPLASSTDPYLLPISEGAPIWGLAFTPDGRYLIAALGDGRASVRAMPDGTLVAHLVPMSDGSWATLFADGHYEASATGDARSLLIEDPDTRRVATLDGHPLPFEILSVSQTPLAEGPVLIKATISSPRGLPAVKLDGRWPVSSIIRSPTVARAYDVEVLVADPEGGTHVLEASVPDLDPVRREIAIEPMFEPDPRRAPRRPRALLIGNDEYTGQGVRRLPGATKDVDAVAAALAAKWSWALSGDGLRVRNNRSARQMLDDLDAFFGKDARSGETLLFYYAGHAATGAGEGHLMGVDAELGSTERAVSAHALWKMIRESPASRILVVLDACQAGAFALPEDIASDATRRKVAFLTSTTEESAAAETDDGGLFTRELVASLHRPESVHPLIGAVTAGKAFFWAGDKAENARQHAMRAGAAAVLDLPLGWPVEKDATPLSTGGATAASGRLRDVSAQLVTSRLFSIEGTRMEDRKLVVKVFFTDDTDTLRVTVHYPYEKKTARPRPELFEHVQGKAGSSTAVVVPLRGLTAGKYRVVVQPCRPGKPCGDEPSRDFPLDLP